MTRSQELVIVLDSLAASFPTLVNSQIHRICLSPNAGTRMTEEFHASRSHLPRFRPAAAGDLCVKTASVRSDANNLDVLELFTKHRDFVSLPVIENGTPIGLINRNIFMSQMSKLYHRELYGKKSCIAFMDKEPLIIDAAMNIEDLTFRAVEFGERALADGFIITREGALAGIGSGLDLMKLVANMHAEKNRQIMHSIDYASVIQKAMLRTSHEAFTETLQDSHLVWQPRDVVGGDFYHFGSYPGGWFAAIADCTGHGVPGAFITLISSAMLVKALQQQGPQDPAALLATVNGSIKTTLGQSVGQAETANSNDGLDAAFLWFDNATRKLTFAGARIGLFLLGPYNDHVEVFDGERIGVGYVESPQDFSWTNKTIQTEPGSVLFVSTDGLIDQIGGEKEIAFGKRRIRNGIAAHRKGTTVQINLGLLSELQAWQGEQRRRDDVTFVCVRV